MKRHRYTVTITATDGSYQADTVGVLATDPLNAGSRAVGKHYGADCWILPDQGSPGHGQIFRGVPAYLGGSSAAVTGRVRIDVTEGWDQAKKEAKP